MRILVINNIKDIKIFFTDIDGVWTDGSMYYFEDGNEAKRFNTYDSAGVLLLKTLNIPVVIISSESSNMVKNRAKKLGIKDTMLGVKNKLKEAETFVQKLNYKMTDVAFIGDDINDLELLKKVGLSACPNNATELIKENVNWVLSKNGGEGVFREFVEKYLTSKKILNETIRMVQKKYYLNA